MAINHLLNQEVTVENPSSTLDRSGNPSLEAPFSMNVRAERTYKTIATKDKEHEPIHLILFAPGDATVRYGAKVTYESEYYKVMTLHDAVVGNGTRHHIEIECQLWNF